MNNIIPKEASTIYQFLIPYLESTTSSGALNALPQLIFLLLTFWVREGQLCEGGGVSFKYVSFLSTYIELQ